MPETEIPPVLRGDIYYLKYVLTKLGKSNIIYNERVHKKPKGTNMPKIIENVREQLLTEAKRQIMEYGYANTTVRSVASACNLGVGTVYNYFKSKDMLIASFMADDWHESLAKMKQTGTENKELFFRCIYSSLLEFAEKHSSLFSDTDAAKVFAIAFAERHKVLRDQIAEIIFPLCNHSRGEFLSQFIAESLLTWTMAEKSFEEIYSIVHLLL